ncbi:MAG: hypothetical protein NTY64_24010 [Deltaproteobacteria bacterium]|nr:hypothetical protein [Deltaproteobacteria bacterium]
MKANQLWELGHLIEKINKAKLHLRLYPERCYPDHQGNLAHTLAILCPAGGHQAEDIAEAFGLNYAEGTMNESELEALQERICQFKGALLQDLNDRIALPTELCFGLDYDPQGNFGLVLRMRDGRNPENRPEIPGGSAAYYSRRVLYFLPSQLKAC